MICPFEKNSVNPYRIYEFHPRGGMNGAAFSVYLNQDVANKLRAFKIKKICPDYLMSGAETILKNLGFYEKYGLFFYEDTFLLHWCRVDGSACEIGIDGNDICRDPYDEPLGYTSHNIDTPLQAYGLLSLWLHWFKYAETALKIT